MKSKVLSIIVSMAAVGMIHIAPSYAQDKGAAAQAEHESHHPGANAPASPAADSKTGAEGMMGKMDMNEMMGMMHECMESHKDGKMCNHDMMEKCEKRMSKSECKKMMRQAKAADKKTKTK